MTIIGTVAMCRCACGGHIVVHGYPAGAMVMAAVREHQATEQHRAWRAAGGLERSPEPVRPRRSVAWVEHGYRVAL